MKTQRVPHFIGTLQNNRKGWEMLGRKREMARLLGLVVVVYGRGPRKKIFEERAKQKGNWEYGLKWTSYHNNHYRPKVDDCTHFDCYVYQRKNGKLIPLTA